MGLPSLITILGAVGCAAKPYAALLAEVNACANRADPPNTSLHVWTGARGHPEIGNLFVVLVHATLAALALAALASNRWLALGSPTAPTRRRDLWTLLKFQRLFGTRLPGAAAGLERCVHPRCGCPPPRGSTFCAQPCAACNASRASGWLELPHYRPLPPEPLASCIRNATRAVHARRPNGATCCKGAPLFAEASHAAISTFADFGGAASSKSGASRALLAHAAFYTHPEFLKALATSPEARFAAAVHARLVLPRVDHSADRFRDPCAIAMTRHWTASPCRHTTYQRLAATLPRTGPVFVAADAPLVAGDLIAFLRGQGIDAQGFVTNRSITVPALGDGQLIDLLEWWLLSRSDVVVYGGGVVLKDRVSSYSLRAADAGDCAMRPVFARGQNCGQAPRELTDAMLAVYARCRAGHATVEWRAAAPHPAVRAAVLKLFGDVIGTI